MKYRVCSPIRRLGSSTGEDRIVFRNPLAGFLNAFHRELPVAAGQEWEEPEQGRGGAIIELRFSPDPS